MDQFTCMRPNPPTITVTVSPWLLALLATAHDCTLTDRERAEARTEIVGYLSGLIESETSDR